MRYKVGGDTWSTYTSIRVALAVLRTPYVDRVYRENPDMGVSGADLMFYVLREIYVGNNLLSGVPDYFGRNKISSGGDLSHYSSASLY